jgi:hypothetical protein
MRYIGMPLSDEQAQKNFQSVLLRVSQQAGPQSLYRVIEVTADSGQVASAGFVRLKKVAEDESAMIGVMLRVEYEGRGLAYLAQKH